MMRRDFLQDSCLKCAVLLALLLMTPSVVGAQTTSGTSRPTEKTDTTMQHLTENYASRHRGKVSLYAKDLRSGRTVAINPDAAVNTASVIKVAIMLDAMYQVKEGRISSCARMIDIMEHQFW